MRIHRSWVLCVLTITALVIAVHEARAQSYPYPGPNPAAGGYPGMMPQMQPGMPGQGPSFAPQYVQGSPMGPIGYPAAGQAPQGPYGYQPAAYYDRSQGAPPQQLSPMGATPMADPAAGGMVQAGEYGETWCGACGGYGCEMCMGACDDFDLKLLRWLLPYGAGGCGTQRWYDASIEWVNLKRDNVADQLVFTQDGAGTPVLGIDNLTFNNQSGFRASFAVQLGAGNSLETSYIGSINWSTSAQAVSEANDLFSIFSDYGNSPPGGFQDTDQAAIQRIEYSTAFDTIELNYRQRWVAPNPKIQGSWLVGARYMYLSEDFRYLTFVPLRSGFLNYLVSTSNSLTGAQIGGDLWVCIMPGLHIGGEMKVGIYGNRATQRTAYDAATLPTMQYERLTENAAAFLGEGNVALIWRLSQNWTARIGYMGMGMTEVALAPDNFNSGEPFTTATQRFLFIDNSGDVFYHGFTAGVEYLW